MDSKRNKLFIDNEAFITLSMMKEGLLYPVTKLMNKKEADEVNKTGLYNGMTFPFGFILAPSGKRNKTVLQSTKKDDVLELYVDNKHIGNLKVEEVFEIDKLKRVKQIYGTSDLHHKGVAKTLKRLGDLAISGELELFYSPMKEDLQKVQNIIKQNNAKNIVGITTNATPFHRVHERIMRLALENNDLIILFLTKNLKNDGINFNTRYKATKFIAQNYFPKDKVIVVPLNNTYIFSGLNEIIMDSLVIKNFGCNKFVMGQTHEGLGIHYENQNTKTIFDILKGIHLETITINEYVYCNVCKTIVSTNSCPHGSHHHIKYHSEAIFELLKQGIIPPPIIMRKELTAIYLTSIFKNRFKNLQQLYYDLIPNNGIIEKIDEEKFYIQLIKMYQTTSMT